MKNKRFFHNFIFTIVFLMLWQGIVASKMFPVVLFPSVKAIVVRWIDMVANEQLVQKVLYSCSLVLVAIALSFVITTVLIVISKRVKTIKYVAEWLSAIASPLPGVAILPLVILWMGISQKAMVFVLVHAMFWPLWNGVDLAVDRIDHHYHKFMKVYHLSFFTRVYHVYFKGILRDLYSGLNIAWSRGWRALISIEMIFGIVGEHGGLGWLIYERRMYMDTAGLYASVFTIAVIGIIAENVIFKRGGRYA